MELKNCPFCGNEAKLKHQGNDHLKKRLSIIECSTIGCFATQRVGTLTRYGFEWTDEKVIERWNTRVNTKS